MSCGIYKYTNKINGHIYIGQAVDIKARIRGHRFSANHPEDKDASMPIHRALRKYGEKNFDIKILEECSCQELDDRERYWVKYYNSYLNGYNANPGGGSCEHLGKPVCLYGFDGNFVKEYKSVTEAAKSLEINRQQIYSILQGQRKSAKGYQFKYKSDNTKIDKYTNRQGGKIPILQYTKDGVFIQEWESSA